MSDNLGFLIGDVSRLIRRTFDKRAKAIGDVTEKDQEQLHQLLEQFRSNLLTIDDEDSQEKRAANGG